MILVAAAGVDYSTVSVLVVSSAAGVDYVVSRFHFLHFHVNPFQFHRVVRRCSAYIFITAFADSASLVDGLAMFWFIGDIDYFRCVGWYFVFLEYLVTTALDASYALFDGKAILWPIWVLRRYLWIPSASPSFMSLVVKR